MTPKDLLIRELDTVSDPLITEVLDFLILRSPYSPPFSSRKCLGCQPS